ncbi:hypothetical protein EV14_0674 [Prochlorococcus sp. MIT 0703]|nr:hypothetical protein EV12_0720 [Prochlorococcus sp. MIT 0701]KGG35881.1 hypothetical protein EV14_0674 [Prochlorococcus sp. MIT 0703]
MIVEPRDYFRFMTWSHHLDIQDLRLLLHRLKQASRSAFH